jgi:hypothetical protein
MRAKGSDQPAPEASTLPVFYSLKPSDGFTGISFQQHVLNELIKERSKSNHGI